MKEMRKRAENTKQSEPVRRSLFYGLLLAVFLVSPQFALSREPAESRNEKITIALVGDSTMTVKSGWGGAFAKRFKPDTTVLNFAAGGRSSKSWYDEGRLDEVLRAKPNYVLIQFGHNDQPGKGEKRETDPGTSYREYLKIYVEAFREIGTKPIIVSPLTRRVFDDDGKITSTLTPWAEAAKAVAAEMKLPFIDLHAVSIRHHNQIGPEESRTYIYTPRKGKKPDVTHLNKKGAEAITKLIVAELKTAVPKLAACLKAPAEAPAKATTLKVMTFNVRDGGTKLGQPLTQTAKVIELAQADVVGLQEIGKNAEELAGLLKWNHVSHGWSAILTRHKIVERLDHGALIELDSGERAYVFNLHLNPAPYQPYQLLRIRYRRSPFIETEEQAIASAKKARGEQLATLLRQIEALPDKKLPVFVVGDFNEPSHLDWTEKAAQSGRHPIKVRFPASVAMAEAGFADAWRTRYPDEMEKPGFTWTPLTKADDPKDHHDRIDFVYCKGKAVHLNDVKVVGENPQNADIVISPYPSDHRAVVASFTLSHENKPAENPAD